MARPHRTDVDGAWHHAMNRGARRHTIFLDDRDRRRFLGLLDDLHGRDRIEPHAYCLMGNHFHLILYCPEGNLSEGMHHLSSRYAQRFNKRHGFDGPLFRDRFKSKPIDSDGYLLQASRYVHRNPLDLGPLASLSTYPWSSYAAYLGHQRPPRWLFRSTVLDLAGDAARYRSYVETERPSTDPPDRARSSAVIRAIEAVVATVVDDAALRLGGNRGRHTLARNLVLVLATDDDRVTPKDLAEHYGLAAASSVWSAVNRTRSRAVADHAIARLLRDSRNDLAGTTPFPTSTPGA